MTDLSPLDELATRMPRTLLHSFVSSILDDVVASARAVQEAEQRVRATARAGGLRETDIDALLQRVRHITLTTGYSHESACARAETAIALAGAHALDVLAEDGRIVYRGASGDAR